MRFDDINPEMDWEKFFLVKNKLEQYKIKSILGVIPNCKDKYLSVSKPFKKYYQYLRKYKAYGDIISQHGYQHIYDSKVKGKLDLHSEISGPTITKILTNKTCNLPTFKESFRSHSIFLESMLNNWNKSMNKNDKAVPIT